jgi:enoyl-CoA hydratase
MPDAVMVEVDGGVAVITINRPQARNAVNEAVASGIAAAIDELDPRPDVAAMVLTGAGGTFCAGMDLKGFLAGENAAAGGRGFAGITQRPPTTPVVAAVEGYAVAGGFEIALACDLIVASRDAKLGIPEVKRSLVAAGGALMRMPRAMPFNLAMELALTGEHVPAARLAELGVVNRVTGPGGALDAALELAATIATNGPLALRASKKILREVGDWSEADFWHRQGEIAGPVMMSEDAREGAIAFAEKRPPVWKGK